MSRNAPRVRPATDDDLERVCEIVNHYIEKTVFNFRTEPQSVDELRAQWAQRHQRFPWLVPVDRRIHHLRGSLGAPARGW